MANRLGRYLANSRVRCVLCFENDRFGKVFVGGRKFKENIANIAVDKMLPISTDERISTPS